MAKGRKSGDKKRRTRGHVIADLAVNHVQRHVLLAGYTMQMIATTMAWMKSSERSGPAGKWNPG